MVRKSHLTKKAGLVIAGSILMQLISPAYGTPFIPYGPGTPLVAPFSRREADITEKKEGIRELLPIQDDVIYVEEDTLESVEEDQAETLFYSKFNKYYVSAWDPRFYIDEMDWDHWSIYPNSCALVNLEMWYETVYNALKIKGKMPAEAQPPSLEQLVDFAKEVPVIGYDPYCGLDKEVFDEVGIEYDREKYSVSNPICISSVVLSMIADQAFPLSDYGYSVDAHVGWTKEELSEKIREGYPVIALVRTKLLTEKVPVRNKLGRITGHDGFGHYILIWGLDEDADNIIYSDSYLGEYAWEMTPEERLKEGVVQMASWDKFAASWSSNVDFEDPFFNNRQYITRMFGRRYRMGRIEQFWNSIPQGKGWNNWAMSIEETENQE